MLLFSYVSPLVAKARRSGITVDDLWNVESVASKAAYARFDAKWHQLNSPEGRRSRGRAPTVGDVFWSLFLCEFLRAHILYVVRVGCQIALPNVVRQVRGCRGGRRGGGSGARLSPHVAAAGYPRSFCIWRTRTRTRCQRGTHGWWALLLCLCQPWRCFSCSTQRQASSASLRR